MKSKKWNYAVIRSIFGNLWVGKTPSSVKDEVIFADIKDAIDKAEQLFLEHRPCFDPDIDEDEEDYDEDLASEYNNIIDTTEETAEEIRKGMEKFIVE